jgi:hypothetical protein
MNIQEALEQVKNGAIVRDKSDHKKLLYHDNVYVDDINSEWELVPLGEVYEILKIDQAYAARDFATNGWVGSGFEQLEKRIEKLELETIKKKKWWNF